MRIAALGRTKMLLNAIQCLHHAGHEIVLIGTCKESPEYDITVQDFENVAKNFGSDFFCNSSINSQDIIQRLSLAKADIAISVNWLTVIGEEAISAFPMGILNAHSGDLPKYRGNACPNWAIVNGEEKITVTIHLMESGKIDSGDIVLQKSLDIDLATQVGEIYQWFYDSMPTMFLEAVDGLGNGVIIPKGQNKDPMAALRCYPRIPADSYINWEKSAADIGKLVRASSEPFSGAYTYFNDLRLNIWKAYPTSFECPSLAVPGHIIWRNSDNGEVGVATGDGVLVLKEIQLAGCERDLPVNVIKSLRTRLGVMIPDEIITLKKEIEALKQLLLIKK